MIGFDDWGEWRGVLGRTVRWNGRGSGVLGSELRGGRWRSDMGRGEEGRRRRVLGSDGSVR